MKIILTINWLLITLLSLATGIFKILQQPEDIRLFEKIGMSATATTGLGIIQFIGGVMLIVSKTRTPGAWIMIPTYILASIAVFANEMHIFGMVSLLFIVMSYGVIVREKRSNLK